MNNSQFWESLRSRVRKIVLDMIDVIVDAVIARLTADGKVKSVSADGKRVEVYINGAEVATPDVLNPNNLPLVADEEVVIFKRSSHDRVVWYKKITS